MRFYTSYYANIKNIPKDYITVSISGDIPQYIKDEVQIWDRRLAPTWDLFKEYKNSPEGAPREKQYIERFKKEVLNNRDLNEIIKSWSSELKDNKKYVIMCYEKPDEFCHRHIAGEAISEKYGIEVQELGVDYNNYELKDYKIKPKGNLNEDEW